MGGLRLPQMSCGLSTALPLPSTVQKVPVSSLPFTVPVTQSARQAALSFSLPFGLLNARRMVKDVASICVTSAGVGLPQRQRRSAVGLPSLPFSRIRWPAFISG